MTTMSDLFEQQKLARKIARLRDWKVDFVHEPNSIGETATGMSLPTPAAADRGMYVVRNNRLQPKSRRRKWVAVAVFAGPTAAADANRYVARNADVVV